MTELEKMLFKVIEFLVTRIHTPQDKEIVNKMLDEIEVAND